VSDLTFRHHDAQGARGLRETVALIHRDAYAAAIATGDPFESHEAFMQRFDGHTAHSGFRFVIGYLGDEPVGQTWGWPLGEPTDPNSWQIAGHGPEPAESVARRAFALAEIMVRSAWTGQGVAHVLHDELLGPCTEKLAELFVHPDNARAYRAYLKWGWRKVTEVRPSLPDAPLFDVLVLPLPVAAR
jgi:GNAT superfamily N-acetyltransferase